MRWKAALAQQAQENRYRVQEANRQIQLARLAATEKADQDRRLWVITWGVVALLIAGMAAVLLLVLK